MRNSKGQFVKGILSTPKPFIKGEHPSSKTEFKKGQKSWNTGKNYKLRPRTEHVKRKIGNAQLGEKNHAWKGGITPLRQQIYNSFNWRQWRSDIFKRDNFTCVLSGHKGKLEADHIKKFSVIMKENNIKTLQQALDCAELWDINNGRTLCRDCHLKTPTYGNRKNI